MKVRSKQYSFLPSACTTNLNATARLTLCRMTCHRVSEKSRVSIFEACNLVTREDAALLEADAGYRAHQARIDSHLLDVALPFGDLTLFDAARSDDGIAVRKTDDRQRTVSAKFCRRRHQPRGGADQRKDAKPRRIWRRFREATPTHHRLMLSTCGSRRPCCPHSCPQRFRLPHSPCETMIPTPAVMFSFRNMRPISSAGSTSPPLGNGNRSAACDLPSV